MHSMVFPRPVPGCSSSRSDVLATLVEPWLISRCSCCPYVCCARAPQREAVARQAVDEAPKKARLEKASVWLQCEPVRLAERGGEGEGERDARIGDAVTLPS